MSNSTLSTMTIDNWESKKFSRGKGDEKVCYDVQYLPTPERPVGVPPWRVGWYKELYGQCGVVTKYGFTARNAKNDAEYDTLIVQLRNPGSFRQYLAMNYYQRVLKGPNVECMDYWAC